MTWMIIKTPDGRYARFSEVNNNITHGPLTEDEAWELCKRFGKTSSEADHEVFGAMTQSERWDQAVAIILENHGEEGLKESLEELGISDQNTSIEMPQPVAPCP